MNPVITLKPIQREIVSEIHHFTQIYKYPPSRRDIASKVMVSLSTIQYHLERLQKLGIIDWTPHVARSITVLDTRVVV